MSFAVREILRRAHDESFWRSLAPHLTIGAPFGEPWDVPSQARAERDRLRDRGYAVLERVVPPEACAALASGIRALHDANVPTSAIYTFDQAWALASRLGPTFEALLGAPPRVLRDVWAWLVPSADGARGWKAHRGVYEDVRGTLVNVWIALSDVTEANACMHVVPLPDDPNFPNALDRIDRIEKAIALPVPCGSVLVWNANVLHWGGEMTRGASPRVSASFTLSTIDRPSTIEPTHLRFDERVDVLADMLVTYDSIAHVDEEWREWARLDAGMRSHRR